MIDSVKANPNTGSSTCVIAKFDTSRPNYLKATNLGDSGYLLLRPDSEGKLDSLYRTKEQQHSFNFPFQCGTGHDLPYAANDLEHEIQENDIIIMASDGVFDNMYDPDLIECVTPYMKSTHFYDPQGSSDCIADKAYELGNSKGFVSPFAVGARAAGRNYPDQGKSDDIAVITAQIHKKSESY